MPSHRLHRYFSKFWLGRPYGEVHRAIDRPYLYLGRAHRRVFHTPIEAYTIGSMASSEPRAGEAGIWHIWLDKACSKDKTFKKWLDTAEKADRELERTLNLMRRIQKRKQKAQKRRRRQTRVQHTPIFKPSRSHLRTKRT
jgi:hypothetical protein